MVCKNDYEIINSNDANYKSLLLINCGPYSQRFRRETSEIHFMEKTGMFEIFSKSLYGTSDASFSFLRKIQL